MIPIKNGGNVVMLVDERVRVADLVKSGQRLRWLRPAARRTAEDKPLSVAERENARREADYIARRNGVKPAHLQLWRFDS
ncbi:hypothetical protein EKK97_13865 [Billgrantia tianxiuensis]|uniref:Uncharacterized protein n=1 Tax=Billgrantia tianxiuensis TaxID=2497861 RepID=A0A6I6SML2_9GAMM|nr:MULTISPECIES: hypothetical protein [Halomonas]MCE8034584.1 hypothetical protein [Halomonas sp. MCCC 1A11057]QHC50451.1 hypothetical protein EKK97_13865 [Halomonas tianxiuensis]